MLRCVDPGNDDVIVGYVDALEGLWVWVINLPPLECTILMANGGGVFHNR